MELRQEFTVSCFLAVAISTVKKTRARHGGSPSVIPALWEAEVDGSRGQEFESSLTNMVKPHLYKKYKN